VLTTERVILRRWQPGDLAPFGSLNADPQVMEYFPAVMNRAESDALVDRIEMHFAEHGWGLWAAERRDTGDFIGFVGLSPVPDDLSLAPGTEVGWRLARAHWGQGFATEGARASLAYAFNEVGLDEILSFTSAANVRSQRVMQKLGMHRDSANDFEHPRFPDWSDRHHVVYRLARTVPDG
jgi:ribosomal-protein-alanine N-acetyltransferase